MQQGPVAERNERRQDGSLPIFVLFGLDTFSVESGMRTQLTRHFPCTAGVDLLHRHRDGLEFGVVGESRFTAFATDAAHLEATEWGAGIEHVVAVHPHRSGPQSV